MEEEKVYMLTTVDNPYNPFTQWDLWYNFDQHAQHYSCEYLDRVSDTSDGFTEAETIRELNRAIDWIVKNDPLNIYRKVTADSFNKVIKESEENRNEFENVSSAESNESE